MENERLYLHQGGGSGGGGGGGGIEILPICEVFRKTKCFQSVGNVIIQPDGIILQTQPALKQQMFHANVIIQPDR